MTKEELKQEAEEYADGWATPDLDSSFRAYMFEASKEGYLAGAWSREKQIEELEDKLEQTEKDLADYQFNYPTIKELEKENARLTTNEKTLLAERKIIVKENAELKARLNAINLLTPELEKLSKLKTQQLTKAKVALRNVIDYLGQFCSDYPDCVIEAEKILKEE